MTGITLSITIFGTRQFRCKILHMIYGQNIHKKCSLILKFLFYNMFISCLYMFRAHVLIIRRSKLSYTASGIITPIGGRLVHEKVTYKCDDFCFTVSLFHASTCFEHMFSSSGDQNCITQPLVSSHI